MIPQKLLLFGKSVSMKFPVFLPVLFLFLLSTSSCKDDPVEPVDFIIGIWQIASVQIVNDGVAEDAMGSGSMTFEADGSGLRSILFMDGEEFLHVTSALSFEANETEIKMTASGVNGSEEIWTRISNTANEQILSVDGLAHGTNSYDLILSLNPF